MKRGHHQKTFIVSQQKKHIRTVKTTTKHLRKERTARTQSEQMSCEWRRLPSDSWHGDVVIERTVYQALSLHGQQQLWKKKPRVGLLVWAVSSMQPFSEKVSHQSSCVCPKVFLSRRSATEFNIHEHGCTFTSRHASVTECATR